MSSDKPRGIEDSDREVHWLGEIKGLEVRDSGAGPLLAIHGDQRSGVVVVHAHKYVDAFARAGVELEQLQDE